QDPKHPRYDDYMQIIEDEIGEIEFDPTYFNSHDIKF
ncbi:plasmid pRiA4b ORF-3 family protein, partial [Acinetobacter baumannii]|nr:plasmid pRiA4b ORF-3 family protein [Acinetobacter baumannii]MDV4279895.1 plasmid pRiA4b ORF-3 family protein [Acinetobacter baumannii]